MIPITILTTLVLSVVTDPWRIQTRTNRAKVYEAGEGDDPVVLGVDNITTIELEETALDI